MPVATRSQSLRRDRGEDDARPDITSKKPVRRNHTTGARGAQSRLTRTIWEARLENFKVDPVFLSGQTFARTVDPFTKIKKLLDDEVKVERELIATSQTWRHMIYPLDQQNYLAIKSLLSPAEDVTRCTMAVRNHIATLLSKGQSNAWSCDLRAVQALVHRDYDGDPARLLRPVDQLSGDSCLAFQATPHLPLAGSWPSILYQNLDFNSHEPEEGFLMNRLLVTVYKAIHRRATDVSPSQKFPVTAASIIYIATLVSFWISAREKYTKLNGRDVVLATPSTRGLVQGLVTMVGELDAQGLRMLNRAQAILDRLKAAHVT
ncbi:hypothetical protein BKA70DRAFT_1226254 [Coprinopsis sp. MPI-PUGE-AT-0042]|nr:hypothetical protein BKA70DRAFT_1226254 [Coprinopsis sp. MPI-PUGE-AT-0042]